MAFRSGSHSQPHVTAPPPTGTVTAPPPTSATFLQQQQAARAANAGTPIQTAKPSPYSIPGGPQSTETALAERTAAAAGTKTAIAPPPQGFDPSIPNLPPPVTGNEPTLVAVNTPPPTSATFLQQQQAARAAAQAAANAGTPIQVKPTTETRSPGAVLAERTAAQVSAPPKSALSGEEAAWQQVQQQAAQAPPSDPTAAGGGVPAPGPNKTLPMPIATLTTQPTQSIPSVPTQYISAPSHSPLGSSITTNTQPPNVAPTPGATSADLQATAANTAQHSAYEAQNQNEVESVGNMTQQQPRIITQNETVEGRLNGLLSEGNPYMQSAINRGMETVNARGLLNSSIAAGAAQRAAIDSAMPIAQQDAQTYATAGLSAQNANQDAALKGYSANLESAQQEENYGYNAALADQKTANDSLLANLTASNAMTADQANNASAMERLNTQIAGDLEKARQGDISAMARLEAQLASDAELAANGDQAAMDRLNRQGEITQTLESFKATTEEKLRQMDIDADLSKMSNENARALASALGPLEQQLQAEISKIQSIPDSQMGQGMKAEAIAAQQQLMRDAVSTLASALGVDVEWNVAAPDRSAAMQSVLDAVISNGGSSNWSLSLGQMLSAGRITASEYQELKDIIMQNPNDASKWVYAPPSA